VVAARLRGTMSDRGLAKVVTAVLLAAVVLGGALSVCVVFGPAWIVGGGSGLTAADRLKAENDVRSTLLQGLGGLLALGGVALGAVMTLRQVRANREGHSIDLFTKAIDQLASDQMSVRHGGVYALEQLSELDARYRGHAHALLTAFVRRHAPWPPTHPELEVPTVRRPLHGGVADDIAAALAALRRRAMIVDGAGSELERVDLRDAELDGLDIPQVCFARSNLEGAHLVGAKLAGATLSDTVLRKTDLSGADLRGADLTRADLSGAVLLGADLTNAKLRDANLVGVRADNTTTWPQGFTPPPPGT
jgi:Pentapeptide repeats (8 copies)